MHGNINDYKFFSGVEFENLYASVTYQDVQAPQDNVSITGDANADAHIRAIAVSRGYKQRVQAIVANLVPVDGERMQPLELPNWQAMKAAALVDGVHRVLACSGRSKPD